jgi:hypothetical protein
MNHCHIVHQHNTQVSVFSLRLRLRSGQRQQGGRLTALLFPVWLKPGLNESHGNDKMRVARHHMRSDL